MPTVARMIAVALLVIVAGCDALVPRDVDPGPNGSIVLDGNVPDVVRSREPLPSCGVERATRQDGPWNLGARRCLLAADRAGQPAEFASTRLTIEGDPFRMVFRVLGPGRVEVLVDSTQDAWSARTWERYACPSLVVTFDGIPQPEFGVDEGCTITTLD
jgi:hypothetical protein